MKKLHLGLAALVALCFVILAIVPSMVDWTAYRRHIAAEIEQAIGRKLIIGGMVEAAILPVPRLSLYSVSLGNLSGVSSPLMAQAEKLEARLALWPLLRGKVVVTSAVLHKPVIVLERLADGRGNWQFTGPEMGNDPIRPPVRFSEGAPFNSAIINDGTIIYRDERTGTIEQVSGLNARFTADEVYGPLRLAGELHYGSIPLRFSVSTGRLDPTGQTATPINVTTEVEGNAFVTRSGQPARGSGILNGTFRYGETGLLFGGKLKFSGDDLADFMTSLVTGDPLLGFLAQSFNMEGEIELQEKTLTANSMSLQLGETRAEGAISAAFGGDMPRLDIALTMGRVNLESWRAAAARKASASKPAEPLLVESEPSDFVLPANVLMTMDVSIDALTYRGTAARQAHLAAEMSGGVVEIHQLAVQLPGATDAIVTGKLQSVAGRAQFDGNGELASDDFRTLLGWFDVDITKLPAGRLNKVSAISHVKLTRGFLTLDGLDLRFDNSRLSGAVTTALHERPAIGADLVIDRIGLDAYLPSEFMASQVAADQAAQSVMPQSVIPLSILTEFDANLRLSLGQFDKGNTVARNARLEGNLVDGVFTIDALSIADLAGGGMTLSGRLDGFADRLRLDLAFDIHAPEPADLLRLTGAVLPLPDSAIKPLDARGTISGDATAYRIDGRVKAAALSVSLNGDLTLPPNAPAQFAFDMGLEHPDYIDLLRLFDAGFAPELAAPARAVDLAGHVTSDGRGYTLSSLSGAFGSLALDGDASVTFDGARPRIDAQLLAGDIDTRHFLSPPPKPARAAEAERWSALPIALDELRLFDGGFTVSGKSLRHGKWAIDDPTAEFSVANGGIDLQRLEGYMMRGEFALQGRLGRQSEDNPIMALDYNLTLSGAELGQALFDSRNIDLSGGRLDLAMEGRATGTSEAALLAALNGKGTILMENTQLKGFDLARLNGRFAQTENPGELVRLIQSTMSSGTTRVAKLDGDFTVTDGVVAFDDLRFKTAGGDVRVLFAADLPHWRLDATAEIRLAAQPRAPRIDMQLGGALDAPKREFDSYALQVYVMDEKARQAPARAAPQTRPSP